VTALSECGVPVVAISEPVPGIHCETVDNVALARMAVNHLINGGHRRIACIGGDPRETGWFTVPHARTLGFREALREAGLPVREDWLVNGEYTAEGGRVAMAALLSTPRGLPTAVFCQSDEMAFGALHTVRAAGLRCPQDISVVGVDDHDVAAYVDLTTVAQPVDAQAEAAARWLVSAIEGDAPQDAATVLHPARMVVRGSTARVTGRVEPEPTNA
jgi:DNA-binding LacI/PurR family transcriptional regulator